MPRVRLFHWRAEEGAVLMRELRAAGYTVDYPGDKENGSFRSMRDSPTHAAVIDLTRLPSHARYVAREIRAHKSTRSIPIVFVDGDADKVARIRGELPDAIYTSRARLAAALKRAKPVANPVVPPPMMQSYGDRTTAQKMGIKEGVRVAVIDAPAGYAKAIGVLPKGAAFEEDPMEVLPVTLWFVHDAEAYQSSLARMREIVARTRLWVVWPKAGTRKAAQSGLTQYVIRESAIAVGLVDYKICSVDQTWSAMVFARKK